MLFVVLGSGVVHALWNAITKAAKDRIVIMGGIGAAITLCGAVLLPVIGMPARDAIVFAVVSAVIHIGYYLLLVNSYRLGDFNQAYPVARGTSPLVVTLGAFIFVSETPSPLELAGVVVLAAGLMSLAFSSGFRRAETPALAAAVATGLAIACYSIVDGIGARHSGDALSYAAFLFVMEGPGLMATAAIARRGTPFLATRTVRVGFLAGFLSFAAYTAVLWAQTKAPLAEVSALRETGVISAAVIGALFFKEGFGARRVLAAVVVAAGIVLIGL